MLGHPAVRRLFAARLLSMATAEGAFFVGIWGRAAYEMDADAADLALLMLCFAAGAACGGLLAGPLVDRLGPRRILVGSELAMVPAALAMIVPGDLVGLTAAATAWALVAQAAHTSMGAVAPFVVRGEAAIGRANAAIEMTTILAFVVGPAAAAGVAATAGLRAVFVLDAVSSLCSALILAGLVEHRPETSAGPGDAPAVGLWRVARDALADPRLRFLLTAGLLTYLSFGIFSALEPLFFRDVLRTDPAALGWVNSLVGVGLATGTLALGRAGARLRRELAVAVLTACSALGAIAYTVTASLAVVIAAALAWGAVLGMLLPTLRTLVQLSSPASRVGRMSSLVSLSETAGDVIPLLLAPAAAAALGVQPALVTSGVVVLAIAVLLVPSARRLDRGPRRAEGEQHVTGPPAVGPA